MEKEKGTEDDVKSGGGVTPAHQFMVTEQFVLQSARAATIADANGRASQFLTAVSSAVVALAFIGQVSGLGESFFVFALVLFPSLFLVGLATFVRVLQTAIEDVIHARGINRIRHYYVEVAPELKRYFVHSTHDDMRGMLRDMGVFDNRLQEFMTTSGMIAAVNSVLAGAFAGLLARFAFTLGVAACAGVGVGLFLFSFLIHGRYQRARWAEFEKNMTILFPSGGTGRDD